MRRGFVLVSALGWLTLAAGPVCADSLSQMGPGFDAFCAAGPGLSGTCLGPDGGRVPAPGDPLPTLGAPDTRTLLGSGTLSGGPLYPSPPEDQPLSVPPVTVPGADGPGKHAQWGADHGTSPSPSRRDSDGYEAGPGGRVTVACGAAREDCETRTHGEPAPRPGVRVPEPTSLAALASGIAGLLLARRRRAYRRG